MAKDAVATMGAILPADVSGRDAVHVAVFSATSTSRLFPGQDVAIAESRGADTVVVPTGELVGIVDPFLSVPVPIGERFWVYLYPRTITALSHRWSHPAFEATGEVYTAPSTKLESEVWLLGFCRDYDNKEYGFDMMDVLKQIFDGQYDDDEYLTVMGSDEKGTIPTEVWHHASIVFGQPIPARHPTYFSCSC